MAPSIFRLGKDASPLPFASPKSSAGISPMNSPFEPSPRGTIPVRVALSKKKLFLYQILFLGTGLFTTLSAQWLWYAGAANEHLLLSIWVAYLGMALVSDNSGYVADANTSKVLYGIAAIDMFALICGTVGMLYIGSGIYQVIHSSVIVFTALLTRLTNKSRLKTSQWMSLFIITLGLGISRLGATHGKQHPFENVGMLLSLVGTLGYAVVYTLNEKILGRPHNMPPRYLCRSIGRLTSSLIGIYIVFYTIPNLEVLLWKPMKANGTSIMAVGTIYVLLGVSSYVHNLTYFYMMSDVGAVTTGVLSSVRAVLVFGLSSALYCGADTSQCYTGMKAISTIFVSLGVFAFSLSKR